MFNQQYKEFDHPPVLHLNPIYPEDSVSSMIWKVLQDKQFHTSKEISTMLALFEVKPISVFATISKLSNKDWFDFKNINGVRLLKIKDDVDNPHTKKEKENRTKHPYYKKYRNIINIANNTVYQEHRIGLNFCQKPRNVLDVCQEWDPANSEGFSNFSKWLSAQLAKFPYLAFEDAVIRRQNRSKGFSPSNCFVTKIGLSK